MKRTQWSVEILVLSALGVAAVAGGVALAADEAATVSTETSATTMINTEPTTKAAWHEQTQADVAKAKADREAYRTQRGPLRDQRKAAKAAGDTATYDATTQQLKNLRRQNLDIKHTDKAQLNEDAKTRWEHGAHRDYGNNPPGPRGGRGTNWENPPGPRGGRGASPNRRGDHH